MFMLIVKKIVSLGPVAFNRGEEIMEMMIVACVK